MVLEAHHPNHSVLEHAKARVKILWISKCIPKSSRQRPVKTVPYRLPHLRKKRKQNTNFQHSGPNPPKRVKEKPDRKKWNFSVPALEMPTSQSGSASGWWIFTTVSEQYPWRKLEVAVLPDTFNVAEGPRLQTFKGKILRMWTRKGSLTSAP